MDNWEWTLTIETGQKKYNPSQPRVPAGQSGGGRWTSGSGVTAIRQFESPGEAAHFGEGMFGGWNLSDGEAQALKEYTGYDYAVINGLLRRGPDKWTSDKQKQKTEQQVAAMDAALERTTLPKAVKVHRGMCGSQECLEQYGTLDIGDEFSDIGYTSTAMLSSTTGRENKKIQLHINLPEGTKAGYLEPLGNNLKEYELLLPRGTRFRIVNKYTDKDKWWGERLHFDVEVVGQEEQLPVAFKGETEGQATGEPDKFAWELGDIVIHKRNGE